MNSFIALPLKTILMKQIFFFFALIMLSISHAQGQLFASANQPKHTDNLQYSTYNLTNLKPGY